MLNALHLPGLELAFTERLAHSTDASRHALGTGLWRPQAVPCGSTHRTSVCLVAETCF